jgi:hypothetical protein
VVAVITVDDNHKIKHQVKSDLSILIIRDSARDDMYWNKYEMMEMLKEALFHLDATFNDFVDDNNTVDQYFE